MYILTIDDAEIDDCLGRADIGYWAPGGLRDSPHGKDVYRILESDSPPKHHLLTRAKIQAGLQRMLVDSPANLQGIIDPDRRDKNTGDALIQFALFGELKYG